MLRTSLLSLALVAGISAVPAPIVKRANYYDPFPLDDGFPSPSASQLAQIEKAAGGTLPNSPLPTYLAPDAVVNWQLIALNEIFEVAYFNSLYQNVSSGAYDVSNYGGKDYVEKTIFAIRNQEELHHLGANAILASAGQPTIKGCKYRFPVSDFKSAILLAQTFTDVVIGVLPAAQVQSGIDGGDEIGLIQLLGAVIGQEAQQDGWFRSVQGKTASAAPFLQTNAPAFALNALLSFIVPGSCPNSYLVTDHVPVLPALTVVSGAKNYNSTVTYQVSGSVDSSSNSVVYISGQNLPVTVSISNVQNNGGATTFDAPFPFDAGFANGLTLAAVVNGTGQSFANASAVAEATYAGPGLIEID